MRWPFEQELTEETEDLDLPVPSSVVSVASVQKRPVYGSMLGTFEQEAAEAAENKTQDRTPSPDFSPGGEKSALRASTRSAYTLLAQGSPERSAQARSRRLEAKPFASNRIAQQPQRLV